MQAPRTAAADATEVTGWAVFPRDEVIVVIATVDGRHATVASIEAPPDNVVMARRWSRRVGIPCGWRATLDLAEFRGRTVSLGGLALSRRGVTHRLEELRIEVGEPRVGAIDQPEPGERMRGRVYVSGWAVPPDRPIGRVEVRVDGRDVGFARLFAIRRTDIAEIRDAPTAPMSGWDHLVTIEGPAGSRARIEADVVDLDGARIELPPVVVVLDREPAPMVSPNGARAVPIAHRAAMPARKRGPGLRIVAVTQKLDIGGAQLFLHELLLTLAKEDKAEIAVIAEYDGPLRAELESLGIPVTVMNFPVKTLHAYERAVTELEQLVLAHDPDVMLVNSVHVGIGGDVAHRLGIPTIWAIHESYTLDDVFFATYGANGIADEVRARIVDALTATAVVTFEADATRRVYAAEVDNPGLLTVHYGIDTDRIDEHRRTADPGQLRRDHGLPPSATVLLCPATFEPRKGQVVLVTAFAELATEFPDALLVLLGGGQREDVYAKGLQEVVDRFDLNERVRLEPIALDPLPWFSLADAVILPSDVEALPRVLLEAMAFELPVAATEVWGVPEAVEDGVSGLLFPRREVTVVIDALRRLLAMSPAERAAFGAAGSRKVHEDFGMGYVDLYRRLLQGLMDDPDASPQVLLQR